MSYFYSQSIKGYKFDERCNLVLFRTNSFAEIDGQWEYNFFSITYRMLTLFLNNVDRYTIHTVEFKNRFVKKYNPVIP